MEGKISTSVSVININVVIIGGDSCCDCLVISDAFSRGPELSQRGHLLVISEELLAQEEATCIV